jgi:hypothetical protein
MSAICEITLRWRKHECRYEVDFVNKTIRRLTTKHPKTSVAMLTDVPYRIWHDSSRQRWMVNINGEEAVFEDALEAQVKARFDNYSVNEVILGDACAATEET